MIPAMKAGATLSEAVTNVALMSLRQHRKMNKAALKSAFKEPCGRAALIIEQQPLFVIKCNSCRLEQSVIITVNQVIILT